MYKIHSRKNVHLDVRLAFLRVLGIVCVTQYQPTAPVYAGPGCFSPLLITRFLHEFELKVQQLLDKSSLIKVADSYAKFSYRNHESENGRKITKNTMFQMINNLQKECFETSI
jgi:hypothetical protein